MTPPVTETDIQVATDAQTTEASEVHTVGKEAQRTNGPGMIDVMLDVCGQVANPSGDQGLLAMMREKRIHTLRK